MDKKPASKKKTSADEFAENTISQAPDSIAIATAIGEGIAKQFNNVREVNTGNAAVVSLEIERKAKAVHTSQRKFAERLANDKDNYVDVVVPSIYRSYQPSFTLSKNGVTVKIPANGRPYKVHRLFADMLNVRLKRLDEKIQRSRDASNQIQFVREISYN